MDAATIRAVRDLLLIIHDEQRSIWSPETKTERKPSAEAQELYDQYCYYGWKPISPEEFESWLHTSRNELDVDFSSRKGILFLPPLEKDSEFVPILKLKCRLNQDLNNLRLYVLLVRLHDEDPGLCGIGFRFDCPEDEQHPEKDDDGEEEVGEGRHDFYHAQLITGFHYGPSIEMPSWLPTTQPSFPLLASDPVTLILALLMTLYGKKYCWDFYNKHASNLPALNPRIKQLHEYVKWKGM